MLFELPMKFRRALLLVVSLAALLTTPAEAKARYTYRIPVPGLAVTASSGTTSPPSGGSSGEIASTASAKVSPTYLVFAQTYVGSTSEEQSVVISNTGTAPLGISGILLDTSSFTQTNNCPASLAPGASCILNVSFVPQAAGLMFDSVTVQTSIEEETIFVSGTGVIACAAQTQTFSSPGTYSVTIPAGCRNLTYTVNGAGGGGYWDPSNGQYVGGAGTQVTGTAPAMAGDSYTVVVGAPGANLCYSSRSAGAAANGALSNFSLNGGVIAQAPGGGGAVWSANGTSNTNALGGTGGAPTGYGIPCPGTGAQAGSVTLSWN